MAVRSSTSVGGAFDPKKYTGPVTKVSADEFHKKLMSFGPEGPPPDWDPRGLEVDESSIGPRKTMRGTGFPAEDAPFDDFSMMPTPYESAPESTFRADSFTGKRVEMPGIREGDGRMWSGATGELMTPKTSEELEAESKYMGYGSEEELDYARSVGMAPPKGLELPKGYTGSLRRELAASPPTKSMLAGKSIDDYYTDIYGKEYTDDPWRRHGFGSWSEIL